MYRRLGIALCLLWLSGCTTAVGPGWWSELTGLSGRPAQYRFDWQISGEPSVAPLQVFDDGRQVWLQYPQDQAVPAIFERTAQGDALRRVRREGAYLVVHGVPEHLVLRGGLLSAHVRRATKAAAKPKPEAAPAVDAPAAPGAFLAHPVPRPLPLAPPPPPPPLPAPEPVAPPYEVTPADGTLRQALGQWAQRAGWTFGAEHWAVDVDIPIVGSAAFGPQFADAVRALLVSTELGERPLQPCFYSNRVLRVIPLDARCDRSRGAGPSGARQAVS